jgi:hypothetical protein
MPLAIFGIENTALNLAVTFAILCVVAIWLALIVFTFTDARKRISDPFLIGCATAASFFPFVGTIVYTILRPAEFLDDAHEREVEVRTSEVRLRHLEEHSCHKCGFPTEAGFMRCPSCRTRLKEECPSCSKPVGMDWKLCPYCETALVAPPKRSSRSSSKSGSTSSKGRRREQSATDERRPAKSASGRSAASSSSSKTSSRSGSGTSSKTSSSRPKSSSSTKPRSGETVESAAARPASNSDSGKAGGSSRRTPRSTRRKPANAGDETPGTKPINSGETPAPSRTPESR